MALSAPTHDFPRRPWSLACALALASFLVVLDITVCSAAMPHVAGGLAVSPDEGGWVLSSYLVALPTGVALSGWLSAALGRRRFYLTALGTFTAASALCGAAPSLGWLVFFRIVQGLAGGSLLPSTQAILVDAFPPERRGMAMSLYGLAPLVGPFVGPLLGGWIVDHSHWRYIFLMNLPLGLIALGMAYLLLEDPRYLDWQQLAQRGRCADYVGILLLVAGFGALQVVYSRGQRLDWFGSDLILIMLTTATVGIAVFVVWELYVPNPLLNLRLFGDRTFSVCAIITYVSFALQLGSLLVLRHTLETLLGYDATRAGLVVSSGGLAALALLPVAGWLADRVDPRILIALALLELTAVFYAGAGMNLLSDERYFVWMRCAQMIGASLLWPPLNAVAFAHVPRTQRDNASTLFSLVRNEGSSLGFVAVSTLGVWWTDMARWRLSENVHRLNPTADAALHQYATVAAERGADFAQAPLQAAAMMQNLLEQQATAVAYVNLFALFALLTLLSLPLVLLIRPHAPPGRTRDRRGGESGLQRR